MMRQRTLLAVLGAAAVLWSAGPAARAALITGETAGATAFYIGRTPYQAVNDSGLSGTSHGTDANTMWLGALNTSNVGAPNSPVNVPIADVALVIDLKGVYTLDATNTLSIWNYNETAGGNTDRGIKTPTFSVSADGVNWTTISGFTTSYGGGQLAQGGTTATTVSFGASYQARYVQIGATNNWGDSGYIGLSEVQVQGTAVAGKSLADRFAELGDQVVVGTANVTASSYFSDNGGSAPPSHLVDDTVGWEVVGQTTTSSSAWNQKWISGSGSNARGWVQFDVGSATALGEMAVWNYNATDGVGRGMRYVDILVSNDLDFNTYVTAYDDLELVAAPINTSTSQLTDDSPQFIDLGAVLGETGYQYVRITNETAFIGGSLPGTWGATDYAGLAKVNFYAPVPEPATLAFLAVAGLAMVGGAAARRRRRA